MTELQCNLRRGYRGVTYPQKDEVVSGSRTVIFFGHSIPVAQEIAGKMFTDPMYNYEARVYTEIVPRLLALVPHFLPSVFVAHCPLADTMLTLPRRQARYLRQYVDPAWNRLGILATVRFPETKPLALYDGLTIVDGMQIFFQICVALLAMETVQGMHNDLFERNVLVRHFPTPQQMTYRLGGVDYVLTTEYQALLFDWDRAFFPELGLNPLLTKNDSAFCRSYNECNHFVRGKDLLSMSCSMRKMVGMEVFRDFFGVAMPVYTAQVEYLAVKSRSTEPFCMWQSDEGIPYGVIDVVQVLSTLANNPNVMSISETPSDRVVDLDRVISIARGVEPVGPVRLGWWEWMRSFFVR